MGELFSLNFASVQTEVSHRFALATPGEIALPPAGQRCWNAELQWGYLSAPPVSSGGSRDGRAELLTVIELLRPGNELVLQGV